MKQSLSRIFILMKRNIKEILRDPLSLIFTLAMPLFMEILFYLLFLHRALLHYLWDY